MAVLSDSDTTNNDQTLENKYKIAAIDKAQISAEFKLDGTTITANKKFLEIFGYELKEIQGKHHSIFVSESHKKSNEYKEFWKKLNHGEYESAEYERIGKNGKKICIIGSYNPIFNKGEKLSKVILLASDITDLMFRAADYEGQIFAVNKSHGMIEFDLDGTIISANENFLRIVGYTLDELKGKHHSILVEPGYEKSKEYKVFWENLNRG